MINWRWPHKPDDYYGNGNDMRPWYEIIAYLPGYSLCLVGMAIAMLGTWLMTLSFAKSKDFIGR